MSATPSTRDPFVPRTSARSCGGITVAEPPSAMTTTAISKPQDNQDSWVSLLGMLLMMLALPLTLPLTLPLALLGAWG
jgi:hypothetical protein